MVSVGERQRAPCLSILGVDAYRLLEIGNRLPRLVGGCGSLREIAAPEQLLRLRRRAMTPRSLPQNTARQSCCPRRGEPCQRYAARHGWFAGRGPIPERQRTRRSGKLPGDQPVPDLCDGLDCKGAAADAGADLAYAREHAVDRVVGYDASIPAALDQFVAGDDVSIGAGERHQRLHDPRLQRLVETGRAELAGRRFHFHHSNRERGLVREHHPPWDGQPVMFWLLHRASLIAFRTIAQA